MTKVCFACKTEKPVEDFYPNNQKADGLSTYCKPCFIEKQRTYHPRKVEVETVHPAGTKACNVCKAVLPLERFGRNKTTKDGLQYTCKPCSVKAVTASRHKDPTSHRRSSKAWREANVERHADNSAKHKYGVEPGTYAKMLEAQDGRCAICKTDQPGTRLERFHIDHCHDTGVVRSLLCSSCNLGLGHFKHNVSLLEEAAKYLVMSG